MVLMNEESSRILWCGNLHENVTEELLYELFLQAGPLEKVKIVSPPNGQGLFGFITFKHESSVPYAVNLMNGIRLFDRPLRLQPRIVSNSAGQSGASSCPGTPVTPIRPNLLTQNPTVVPSPINMLAGVRYPLHLSASPGHMLPPAVSAAHLHPSFHRSYSVPEMSPNLGKTHYGSSGVIDDRRLPYARPGNVDGSPYQRHQRDQYQGTPDNSGTSAAVMAQLQALRQATDMQAGYSRSQHSSESPSQSRHHHHHQQQQQQQQHNHRDSYYGSYSNSSRRHDRHR